MPAERIWIGRAAACLLAVALVPSPAWSETRGKVAVRGLFGLGTLEFQQTSSFTEFAEEGRLDADYAADPGPGLEIGLQLNFAERLGIRADVAATWRDQSAGFAATLPHPLYFDQPRQADGRLTGLSYQESALHLDLVYRALRGDRVELELFAGPSLFRVKTDLIESVDYAHSYPFDSVTVRNTPASRFDDSAFGFNVGVGFEYRLGERVGLGAQLRFSRARAELVSSGNSRVEIDAGGLHVGAGLSLVF